MTLDQLTPQMLDDAIATAVVNPDLLATRVRPSKPRPQPRALVNSESYHLLIEYVAQQRRTPRSYDDLLDLIGIAIQQGMEVAFAVTPPPQKKASAHDISRDVPGSPHLQKQG